MKRVLVVGFTPYGFMEKLAKQHQAILFINYEGIYPQDDGSAIVEAVNMVDGVLFMEPDGKRRLAYEVACSMTGTDIYEKSEYPVEEEPVKEKEKPRYTPEGVMIE